MTDKWTNDGRTGTRNINVVLVHPDYEGKFG